MKKTSWKYVVAACSACLFLFTTSANAIVVTPVHYGKELLTFDDLTGTIPFGYGALSWNNLGTLNPTVDIVGESGYQAGLISQSNVVYCSGPSDSTTPIVSSISSSGHAFILNSAYMTAAWNDNLHLEVQGYYFGKSVYTRNYTLSAVKPTLVMFPGAPVTDVVFTTSGGTHHAQYTDGSGEHFAMDNLTAIILPVKVNIASAVSLDYWRAL